MDATKLVWHVARFWWVLVLAVGAGIGSGAYFTGQQPERFAASATVVLGPSGNLGSVDTVIRSLDAVGRRNIVATYAQILSSSAVQHRVRERLELTPTQISLYWVRTSVLPDTNLIRVSVEGPDPRGVAEVANATVNQARQVTPDYYEGILGFRVLDPAVAPSLPVWPNRQRNLAMGGLFGLFIGVTLVLAAEVLRQSALWSARRSVSEREAETLPVTRRQL